MQGWNATRRNKRENLEYWKQHQLQCCQGLLATERSARGTLGGGEKGRRERIEPTIPARDGAGGTSVTAKKNQPSVETAGTPKRASRKTLISQDSFRADRMKHAATRFRRLFEIQSGLDLVSRLPAQSSHRMNIHQTAATTSILMCSAVFGILKIQIGLTIRRTSPRMNFQSAFLRKLNLTGSDSDN